jgi:hypothetical protein
VVHRIRGAATEGVLKQERKVVNFLKHHSMHSTQHDWQEDEWNTKIIAFLTAVLPKTMPNEYARKVVTNEIEKSKQGIKIPLFEFKTGSSNISHVISK